MPRAKQARCAWCKAPEGVTIRRSADRGIWRRKECEPGTPWRNSRGNITTFEPTAHHVERVKLIQVLTDSTAVLFQPGTDFPLRFDEWKQLNQDDAGIMGLVSKLEAGDTIRIGGGAQPLWELKLVQLCEFCATHQPAEVFARGKALLNA